MAPFIVQFGTGSVPRLPPHQNPGLEIVLIQRGRLAWQVEGREEEVTPGSVYFTLPGQLHGSSHEYEPGHEWIFVVIAATRNVEGKLSFHRGLPLARREAAHVSTVLTGTRRHAYRAAPTLDVMLVELIRELSDPGVFHDEQVGRLAAVVVLELARCVEAGQRAASGSVVGRAEHRVRRLVERLRAHPEQAWSLDALATECGLGRSRFSDLFLEVTGDTPIRFLNRVRIELARKRLRETDRPITQIALDCGFETSQYFARVFKQFSEGLDARRYREKMRARKNAR